MSAHTSELATGEQETRARLSTVDRFLPVWIVAAMALGLVLGRVVPGLAEVLDAGARRIVVVRAITGADDPRAAATTLAARLRH